jgi:hypothetical protein
MTTDWKTKLTAIRAELPNKRDIIRKQRILLREKRETTRINNSLVRRRPITIKDTTI